MFSGCWSWYCSNLSTVKRYHSLSWKRVLSTHIFTYVIFKTHHLELQFIPECLQIKKKTFTRKTIKWSFIQTLSKNEKDDTTVFPNIIKKVCAIQKFLRRLITFWTANMYSTQCCWGVLGTKQGEKTRQWIPFYVQCFDYKEKNNFDFTKCLKSITARITVFGQSYPWLNNTLVMDNVFVKWQFLYSIHIYL